jgi:crotonobetainyl-CoA:carnitine CoA-transferase CaiB-like acyl-CoA transferase
MCGRILADLGAEVIRVEPPEGARSRRLPPFKGDQSLFFAYRNTNKKGVALDLSTEAGRARLHALLASVDVLVESSSPADQGELAPERLRAWHPHLIVTSISWFGQTGPYRDWVATDMVLEAVGGMMFKAGIPEKPPLTPPGAMASDVGGVIGVYATLLALFQRLETGAGQHLDVSVMEALAQTIDWGLPNASILRAAGVQSPEVRMGSGPVYALYPCKDGYVRLVVLSPRQWHAMRAWMGEPEQFQDPHWDSFISRLGAADVINPMYEKHFADMTMNELCAEAQRRGIVCTPVLRPEEVISNEHLLSRGTFVDGEVARGVRGPLASGFFEFDGERQGYRVRSPEIGEQDAEELAASSPARSAPATEPEAAAPLAGIRVLDFGIGGVGVEAGRLLAEYGADVIKIESRTYPDFIRVIQGTEMSPSFASSSRSKRSFGVNAKDEAGLAVLHRLVEQADVIVENSSTGTMEGLGVGYDTVKRLNPRCSMVSSQLLGSHGPWADWIGYGPSTQPIGGLVHLWNYTDQDFPAGAGAIFPDHLAGRLCAVAATAALIGRARSGTGSHCEVAQIEAVTGLLGDLLLKAGLEPGSVGPMGNRSERGAPWGAYPCEGEQQWCVINVRHDADWAGLRRALGDPEWARDARLAGAAGRLAAQDEIDAELEAWTSQRSKHEVAERLQAEGIPAAPMLTASEQLDDPHLAARGYPRPVRQQDLADIIFEGPCFYGTGMTDAIIFQAPRLGEHTREVCSELLGMSDAEIDDLLARGALEGPLSTS